MGPFSFWLHPPEVLFYVYICMQCVCLFICLTQLGTGIILHEQWLPKGLGVTLLAESLSVSVENKSIIISKYVQHIII